MAKTSPIPSDSATDLDASPHVVDADHGDADDVIAALRSETARDILAALYEEPATASTLAGRVEASIQTVQYHLESLHESGLVTVADTRYSEKGREMEVFGPASDPLVLVVGDADRSLLDRALARLGGE